MVRIAACQFLPSPDFETRQAQMHDMLAQADKEHVEMICFPEGCLTGYYAKKDQAFQNSLEVGGIDLDGWLAFFKHYASTIIVGFNEREGDKLFDSVAVVENGQLRGVQRKHYLYHDYFTPGTSFTPFQSKGITFGIVICLDANYFEPARLLALQGASVLFSPMCNLVSIDHPYAERPSYYSHFVARSFENRCWLVTADWVWHNDGYFVCPGHSVIYDPDGKEVSRSQEMTEQLLIYDIPQDRLFHEKGKRVHGSEPLAREMAQLINRENSSWN